MRDNAVTIVADDGTVMVTYLPPTHAVRLNGRMVDQSVIDHARLNRNGVMTFIGPKDHRCSDAGSRDHTR